MKLILRYLSFSLKICFNVDSDSDLFLNFVEITANLGRVFLAF